VATDEEFFGNRIYWTVLCTPRDYTSQITVTNYDVRTEFHERLSVNVYLKCIYFLIRRERERERERERRIECLTNPINCVRKKEFCHSVNPTAFKIN
jgi:hypothetical protein